MQVFRIVVPLAWFFLLLGINRAIPVAKAEVPVAGVADSVAPSDLLLSGDDWQVASFEPGEGVAQQAFSGGYPTVKAVPAIVPGDVHWDLERAKILPPTYFGRNSQKIGWVVGQEWWYRKTFRVPAAWSGKITRLQFAGVDYLADVWLNGVLLGRHEGQFTPFEFDVSKSIHYGAENVLIVQIHAAPQAVRDAMAIQEKHREWPIMQVMKQVYPCWKSRTNSGWDWGAKILTMGIWKDVRLVATDGITLDRPIVLPQLKPPYDRATLDLRVDVGTAEAAAVTLRYCVRCLTVPGQPVVATQPLELRAGQSQVEFSLPLDHPQLWWPNGYGPQNLYELEVTAHPKAGDHVLARTRATFGIRDLQMLENPPATDKRVLGVDTAFNIINYTIPDTAKQKYVIQINGHKIFARGGNWIPCDLLHGRPRRPFYEHLIHSAAAANYNTLRIWGGGLIEKPEFYELCDQYGIMLFQDFPNAGERPAETDEALAISARETREILPLLMNHPSIVRYCGGNEWYLSGEISRQIAQLRAICEQADPSRPFHDPDPETDGQRHGPHRFSYLSHYGTFNTGQPLDIGAVEPCEWTEYGASGAASVQSLRAMMPEEDLWPVSAKNPHWVWHNGFDAWGKPDNWLAADDYHLLFGDHLPDLETTVRCSQLMQAEGLRYANQAMRRFRWRRSGCVSWTFNEPWPNAAHGCVIEFSGRPKMAHYYAKQAYAPIDILAVYPNLVWAPGERPDVAIWTTHDGLDKLAGYTCHYRIFNVRGDALAEARQVCELPPESSQKQLDVTWIPPESMAGEVALLWLELHDPAGKTVAQNLYTFGIQQTGATAAPAFSADGRRNLALLPGVKAAASSVLEGYAIHQISHLNDGWYGNSASWIEGASPSWAELNLGQQATISRVRVGNDRTREFTDRGATEFRVLVATEWAAASDAPVWRAVGQHKGEPLQGAATFDFDPQNARWVRIDGIRGDGARIDEIEVYAAEPFAGDRKVAEVTVVRGPAPPPPGTPTAGFLRPLLEAPETHLDVTLTAREEVLHNGQQGYVQRATIRNRSKVPALFVTIEVGDDPQGRYLTDNYFFLPGNAEKTIEILSVAAEQPPDTSPQPALSIQAWNAPEVRHHQAGNP